MTMMMVMAEIVRTYLNGVVVMEAGGDSRNKVGRKGNNPRHNWAVGRVNGERRRVDFSPLFPTGGKTGWCTARKIFGSLEREKKNRE